MQKRISFAGISYIKVAGFECGKPTQLHCLDATKIRVRMGSRGVENIESEWNESDSQVSSWYEFLGDDTGGYSLDLVGLTNISF
jgi:hypothetical protein